MTLGPVNLAALSPLVQFTAGDVSGTLGATYGNTLYETQFNNLLTEFIDAKMLLSSPSLTPTSGLSFSWSAFGFVVSGYNCYAQAGSTTLTGTSANEVCSYFVQLVRNGLTNNVTGFQFTTLNSTVAPSDALYLGNLTINSGNTGISASTSNPLVGVNTEYLFQTGLGQKQYSCSQDWGDPASIIEWTKTDISTGFINNGYLSAGGYNRLNPSYGSVWQAFFPVTSSSNSLQWQMAIYNNGGYAGLMGAWISGAGWGGAGTLNINNGQNTTTWQTSSDPLTKIVDHDLESTIEIVRHLRYKVYRHNGKYGTPLDSDDKIRWGLLSPNIKELIPHAVHNRDEFDGYEGGSQEWISIDTIDHDPIQAAINNVVIELIEKIEQQEQTMIELIERIHKIAGKQ